MTNFTFVGLGVEERARELIWVIKDKLLHDPERSCALVIATNLGPHSST